MSNRTLSNHRYRSRHGFTFVELAIVIAIFSVLFGTAAVALGNFMNSQALQSDGSILVQALREAHARSVASERDSGWGVYLDTTVPNANRAILFKGSSYSQRDPAFDQVTPLHPSVEFGPLLLNGGGSEVDFSKRSGLTANNGLFSLAHQDQSFIVTVNPLGLTDFTPPTP
jgi:prepilin-type N-terminal cleavage/methylation domain-containing protein